MRKVLVATAMLVLVASAADARVVRLRIERRELILDGRAFGAAGPYEKLVGKVDFGLDPALPRNGDIVDLKLAPRNARGEVEASADFYMLKPVDPRRGNGRLFYEVGNRGGKSMLQTFQKAAGSPDPTKESEFGDGALMRQGFTLLWMGWQWDVPERPGTMRMEMPIATENGKPITGIVRGNFILNERANTASVADRAHKAYPVLDPNSADNVMTVRDDPTAKGQVIPRARWHFVDGGTVALDGGFEPGRIYDVVYRTSNPRVLGFGLSGARDLISFLKYDTSADNPVPGLRYAIGWGVSQSGRYLRHFLYQGFNEDEQGRKVFDGVFDQVGGAGRGSFNHRFGQASRDALQYFNILFPVDLFPFTDGPSTDPESGAIDSLLARAERTGTAPKIFHLLTNSEYFNRAGSLVHTDPTGTQGRRPAGEHARLHDCVGAAWPGTVSADVQRRRRHDRARAAQSAQLLARRARAVPRARPLDRGRCGAAAERVSEDRGRHAHLAGEGRLARRARLPAAAAAAARLPPQLRRRLGEGHRQRRAAGSRQGRSWSACRRSTPTATCARASACRTSRCRSRPRRAGTIATPRSARRIGSRAKSDPTFRSRAPRPTAIAPAIRGCPSKSAIATATSTSESSRPQPSSSSTAATCWPRTSPICSSMRWNITIGLS